MGMYFTIHTMCVYWTQDTHTLILTLFLLHIYSVFVIWMGTKIKTFLALTVPPKLFI